MGRLSWEFSSPAIHRVAPSGPGSLPALVGSLLLISPPTALLALPVGGAGRWAIYLEEYGKRSKLAGLIRDQHRKPGRGCTSVIYGLLGLGLFVRYAPGSGAACWRAPPRCRCWCCRSSSCHRAKALAPCPQALREACYALGSTRWQAIRRAVLPTALPGILNAGAILSLSRAIRGDGATHRGGRADLCHVLTRRRRSPSRRCRYRSSTGCRGRNLSSWSTRQLVS